MFCQKKEPPEFCEFAQKSSLFFAASNRLWQNHEFSWSDQLADPSVCGPQLASAVELMKLAFLTTTIQLLSWSVVCFFSWFLKGKYRSQHPKKNFQWSKRRDFFEQKKYCPIGPKSKKGKRMKCSHQTVRCLPLNSGTKIHHKLSLFLRNGFAGPSWRKW